MPGHAGQDRVERLELEVAADLGPDELDPADLDLGPGGLGESGLDLRASSCSGVSPRLGQPDQVLLGVAELLDDRAAQLDLVEAAPDRRPRSPACS